MLRSLAACALALSLSFPGQVARADEGDLSFVMLLGGGLMMLSGTAFCFAEPGEPERFATRSFYAGLGMSYVRDNFQTKGGGTPYDPPQGSGGGIVGRRWVGRNDDAGQPTDRDARDLRPPETPNAIGIPDLPELLLDADGNVIFVPGTDRPAEGAPNGIAGETRPDAEDGFIPPAIVDGGSFGADVVTSVKVEDGTVWGINGRLGFRCHPRSALEAHFEWLGEDFDLSFDTVGLERSDPTNALNGKTELHYRHVSVDSEMWTIGTNARLFLSTGRVQPYVLGGLGIMRLQESAVRSDVARTSPTGTEVCPQVFANRPRLTPTPGGDASTDPNRLLPSDRCTFQAPTFRDSDQFKDIDLAARLGGGLEVFVTDSISLNLEGVYVRPSGRVEGYDFVSLSAGVLVRFGGGFFRDAAAD